MHSLADWHWTVLVRRVDNNERVYEYLLPAPDFWARVEAINATRMISESSMLGLSRMCLVISPQNGKVEVRDYPTYKREVRLDSKTRAIFKQSVIVIAHLLDSFGVAIVKLTTLPRTDRF